MNGIQDWLGELPKTEFAARYFHALPYSIAGAAKDYTQLCDWQTIERILACAGVDSMVCRRGEQYTGPPPQTAGEAQKLSDDGYTILIRHAEQHDAELKTLADSFARDFGGRVNVHIYATPADQFGFGWHYDAEDVFILQTAGTKEYSLRKNTVQPWPLVETIPADMQYEREIMPLMRCRLSAGDWLYIPAGYWHMATAEESSVSLAIGVLAPSALDTLEMARRRLGESILWRQRLPVVGEASPLEPAARREQVRELLRLLAKNLTELYESDEFLDEVAEPASTTPQP